MIRTVRTTDLLKVLLDGRRVGQDWAQPWERVGSDPARCLSLRTLAQGLPLRRGTERCNVLSEGARVTGVASVRPRSGPKAWEMHCLSIAPGAEDEGVELLERLCMVVGDEGGERVFLRLPASGPVLTIARQAGFLHCYGETLHRKDAPGNVSMAGAKFVRPVFPSDEHGVFRLYCECVPQEVKMACAVTFDEWYDAVEPWGAGEVRGVYEDKESVRAWARVAGGKGLVNRLELMAHTGEEPSTWDDLVTWGFQNGRPGAPFQVLVPEYQSTLSWVLERRGFIPVGEYQVMVKSIAVRAKESALAPAGA